MMIMWVWPVECPSWRSIASCCCSARSSPHHPPLGQCGSDGWGRCPEPRLCGCPWTCWTKTSWFIFLSCKTLTWQKPNFNLPELKDLNMLKYLPACERLKKMIVVFSLCTTSEFHSVLKRLITLTKQFIYILHQLRAVCKSKCLSY